MPVPPIQHPGVAARFAGYPPVMRARLLALRRLILETAAATPGVGPLEETLKWGEPAYVTATTGSGTTLRIDSKPQSPQTCALYVNCQTTLVETFRQMFPHDFRVEGRRALVFHRDEPLPEDALRWCIAAALTYHRRPR